MKLTITTAKDELFTIEIPGDIEIENLKAYCEMECGTPAAEIKLLWNGNPLSDDKKSVDEYGIADGDMLYLQRTQSVPTAAPGTASRSLPSFDFSGIRTPGSQSRTPRQAVDPIALREILLGSPHEIALLKQNNPRLAEALLSNDVDRFVQQYNKDYEEKRRRETAQMALLTGDPFDPEVQRRIAEAIQQENVNENMEAAMEHAPESFGQVHMLYINCLVNGHSVKAFVDSGAQMTIMSKACAQRCNIGHLIDTRWAGIAKGVGVQRILGRIHMCHIVIQNDHLQCSFSILEEQPMDMLLGLDMLKRHQCNIDLKNNMLVIGTTGTSTNFLPESELPEYARLNRSQSSSEQERDLAEAMLNSTSNTNPSTSSGASGQSFPEDSIQKIVQSGFNRQQAITELTKCSGNVDTALMNLLAKSLGTPSRR